MAEAQSNGRPNQRRRTRKDLLDAAARLVAEGRRPSLDDVAQEALVSRATAYRYFPNIEALMLEAAVHVAAPNASVLDGAPADLLARVQRVDDAFQDMMLANETPLRLMLAQALERAARGEAGEVPARQNRRAPLIEAALEPARARLDRKTFKRLVQALSLIVGTEGFIATRDVLQLDDAEARALKRWAIGALMAGANAR
jgi:AcrR family transcriptional regulator